MGSIAVVTPSINRSPDHPILRSLLAASLVLVAAVWLPAQQPSSAELEEVAEFARHAAAAAIRGSPRIFSETLDVDGILAGHLGADAWKGLTSRQRELLRGAIRERFLSALAAPRGEDGDITWSTVRPGPGAGTSDVLLGLRFGDKVLKTRWSVVRGKSGLRITDVVLADPGVSLARAALRTLGPEPIRLRDRASQARSEAVPRLLGLALIGLIVLVTSPRLSPEGRRLLYLVALAPAILFAGDGVLAVRRVLSERYAVPERPPSQPWAQASEAAVRADRAGKFEEAREHWAEALAAGEDAGPVEYQIGLSYRARGELDHARAQFERALLEVPPAPGAAREIASMAAAAGRYADAERWLRVYVSMAGPDPETLSLAAVVDANVGKTRESVDAIREARVMVGEGWRAAELEARIRARAGDAAGAVAALRPLESEGQLDRDALRSNPDYLPIATEPAWVAFLNERGKETAKGTGGNR
jgi:Flp pilus assembly protein TadD